MASTEGQLREDLAAAGRRLAERGLIAGTEGNLSARLDADHILVSPSGVSKGALRDDDLVLLRLPEGILTDLEGSIGRARALTSPRGLHPTSEIGMHLVLYLRAGVGAVVHAHPPHATAFAAAGRALDPPLLTEQVVLLGEVALLPVLLPSTAEVAEAVNALPEGTRAFLLGGHGATTVGGELAEAVERMEILESCARITWLTRLLDPDAGLKAGQIERLKELRNGGSPDGAGPRGG